MTDVGKLSCPALACHVCNVLLILARTQYWNSITQQQARSYTDVYRSSNSPNMVKQSQSGTTTTLSLINMFCAGQC